MLEVRCEELEALAFGKFEGEATLFFDGVLNVVDLVCPRKVVPPEGVINGVIRSQCVRNAFGRFRARECKTRASG